MKQISAPDPAAQRQSRPFTWEQAEHINCDHVDGAAVAMKADGQLLRFCIYCQRLAVSKR